MECWVLGHMEVRVIDARTVGYFMCISVRECRLGKGCETERFDPAVPNILRRYSQSLCTEPQESKLL